MKWDIHPGIGDYVFLADRAAEKSRMLFFLAGCHNVIFALAQST